MEDICLKLGLHLTPPFNLRLGFADLKVWFPLILVLGWGFKLQFCQTLKHVLEFFAPMCKYTLDMI